MKKFTIELTAKEIGFLQMLVAMEIKNDFALYGIINKDLMELQDKLKGEKK